MAGVEPEMQGIPAFRWSGRQQRQIDLFSAPALAEPAPDDTGPSPVEEALQALDPDGLSPREALEALYRLKALGEGSAPRP